MRLIAGPNGEDLFGCFGCQEKHLKAGRDQQRREFSLWLRERLKLVDEALAGKF